MYRIMVINKDTNEIINIINYIGKRFNNILFYDLSTNIEFDIMKLIKKIDIIIIDYENFCVLKKNLEKYMLNNPKDLKNIIVYNKNSLIGSINKIDVNYNIAKDLNELQLILEKIIKEKTLEKRNNEIEKKVTEELIKLNYDFKYCGTYYMKEIIINIYNNKYAFEGNFEKNVFPTLAVRHNKSANTIYCDIKYATKNMLEKNSQKYLINYFNYSYYTKPKIQENVFNVLNNIE